MSTNNGHSKWISEEEAMQLTGLGKRALLEKRKAGKLNWTSATGRKVQYLRKDIEGYLNHHSTLNISSLKKVS